MIYNKYIFFIHKFCYINSIHRITLEMGYNSCSSCISMDVIIFVCSMS